MTPRFALALSLTLILSLLSCGRETPSADPPPVAPQPDSVLSHRQQHELQHAVYRFDTEAQWDSLNGIVHAGHLHRPGKRSPEYLTFGWHLYSHGSAWRDYNFDLLWGIAYFSYKLDPKTGAYQTVHQWKTTEMIDSARAHGTKVFLTVTNFGADNNHTFLSNPDAQETLADSLIRLLKLRDAHGVNLDFEGVAGTDRDRLTDAVQRISQKLRQADPYYQVSLCLYAIDRHNVFDIEALDPHVTFYTLMGYDYYGGFSHTTGPVTPFKPSAKFGGGLQQSVQDYLARGLTANKLIVGLPYYGAQWQTQSPDKGAKVDRFDTHPRYSTIRSAFIDSLAVPPKFDSLSQSSYLTFGDSAGHYTQIWFETGNSLALKYDWIKEMHLLGVGIWALGYDNGYRNLWDLLHLKFSAVPAAEEGI